MNSVGHDTGAMRTWSGDINKAADDYKGLVDDLYRNVSDLVSVEFTGGLSKEFENDVLDKRDVFDGLYQTLVDCADLINGTASYIDADEEALSARFKNNNNF